MTPLSLSTAWLQLEAALDKAALETLRPFNCKGSPGASKVPENVSCPGGVWTPWQ